MRNSAASNVLISAIPPSTASGRQGRLPAHALQKRAPAPAQERPAAIFHAGKELDGALDARGVPGPERLAWSDHEGKPSRLQLAVNRGRSPPLDFGSFWRVTMPTVDNELDLLRAGRPIAEQGHQVAEQQGVVTGHDAEAPSQPPDIVLRERKATRIPGERAISV